MDAILINSANEFGSNHDSDHDLNRGLNAGLSHGLNQSTLIWAIVCSILLHALLVITLPNFKFDLLEDKPAELTIELVKPKQPEPAPVVLPEPVNPEPIKPEPIKKVVEPKPATKPVKVEPKIERSPEPVAVEATPEPVKAEPQQPPVITVAPKVDVPPVITAPPPEPEKPVKTEPSEQDINSALNAYGNTLGRAIAKHKSYPKIAQMRGWQGECSLAITIDGNGNVQSASVKESSGYESLDKQALEMARKASPFPAPPDALRGRSFNITVPVSFKLE